MKHDVIKLDSIIRRIILESKRNAKTVNEQIVPIPDDSNDLVIKQPDTDIKPNPKPKTKKDKWGRPAGAKWYGFDPDAKKFTEGPNKGKTASEVYPNLTPKPEPTNNEKYLPKARAKRMYDCKGVLLDSEELYRNLIIGSKPERIAGGVLSGGIPAIANEKEYNAVEKELKKLTGRRGIVVYGQSFINESASDIWRPIFEWMGKTLGGDRVKEELGYAGFKSYQKIAEKYKNINPQDPDNPSLEQTLRSNDAENVGPNSGMTSGMPLWIKLTLIALITTGIIGGVGWKLLKGKFFPKVGSWWQKIKLLRITEEEIKQLKNWINEEHAAGRISDEEMIVWNKFFLQKKWLGFSNAREELANVLKRVEKGPNKPANWTRYWDGMSMDTYIKDYLPDTLKRDRKFTENLRKYEKEVLEPIQKQKYGEPPKVKTPKSSTPTPSTPTSAKLTKLKNPPTQTITKGNLASTITISNPENITKAELQKIFAEAGYKDAEQVTKSGEAYSEWNHIKDKYKDGHVSLINTHIAADRVPSFKNWQTDMQQAFPKQDPARFTQSYYKRYKVEFKINQLLK